MGLISNNSIATLTDIQHIEKTPFSEQNLPESTYSLLKESAQKFGEKTALRYLSRGTLDEATTCYSYKTLFHRVNQTANAFIQLGVTKHDVVSMIMPNIPEAHFTMWGAEAAGIFNPINPLLNPEHIISLLNEVNAKILITLSPGCDQELWNKITLVKDRVPSLKYIITVGDPHIIDEHLGESILDFNSLVTPQNPYALNNGRVIKRQDIASMFHTGGTTDTPKLAPHSHENEIACCFQIVMAGDLHKESRSFCGLPLFHVNAVFVTGLASWLVGGEVILGTASGFRSPQVIENFWGLVEKYRISFFSCVPTILMMLLEQPTTGHDLTSLDVALCGAAPLSTSLMESFEAKTGIRLLEAYGQTEGAVGTTCNPKYGQRKVGSVGLPLPYMNIRIVEVDDEGNIVRECGVNEVGSVAICGPNVFSGYHLEKHNKGLWIDKQWFNSGDLGRLDEDGYLWLTGRSKDLIIRGGHNIDPQVIEDAFYKHPDVAQVAAIGKPDKRVGEVPAVCIQLKKSATGVSIDALLDHGAQHIHECAARPKDIFIVEQIPVTAVGKVFKPELRDWVTKNVVVEELTNVSLNSFDVHVEQHKQYGQLVRVQCQPEQSETVLSALEKYAFKLNVDVQQTTTN